ncbi:cysteine desulfurase NifS [Pelomyxa schiedti]|nr:cysteine desulfurase NifS [Pelomyxa schiedti]
MMRVYMDNNATTMVDPAVSKAMMPFMFPVKTGNNSKDLSTGDIGAVPAYGNANSLHGFGRAAHSAVVEASAAARKALGVDSAVKRATVLFNSGSTEGNNHVIKSTYWRLSNVSPVLASAVEAPKKRAPKRNQYITSQVEHPSVARAFDWLSTQPGVEVVRLPVNSEGIVTPDILKKNMHPERVALVSIMWANNETGLINPVADLANMVRGAGGLFHTDATQAVGKLPVNVSRTGVDFLTLSAHKFHGPTGVGALYARDFTMLSPPLFHGGEQMGGLRSGTINVPGVVGLGVALALANARVQSGVESHHVRTLRDRLEDAILAQVPHTHAVGSRHLRTPNTSLIAFRGVEGEALLWDLDTNGVAASTGSACASESLEASPALKALSTMVSAATNSDGASAGAAELAHTGVRFSLSHFTTLEEVDYVVGVVVKAVTRLREISGFGL